MKNEIILLREDYERRLKTIMTEIKKGGNDLTLNRLGTKSSCYRTLISELNQLLSTSKGDYRKVNAKDRIAEDFKSVFCICSAQHEDTFMAVCYYNEGKWWEEDLDDVENDVIYWLEEII